MAQGATSPTVLRADVPPDELWPYQTVIERPERKGKPLKPSIAFFWLPPQCDVVRGIIVAQNTLLEKKLTKEPAIRAVAAQEKMGILFFDPGLMMFDGG